MLAARAVNAAVTGDPNKLAPDPGFNFNIDPNDPKEQKKARASAESTLDLGLALLGSGDPLALAKAAPAAADILVNGDPNEVGQGAGRTFVLAGTAVALGGLGEAGIAAGPYWDRRSRGRRAAHNKSRSGVSASTGNVRRCTDGIGATTARPDKLA
jgi:hypothetical protein